jgi:DNA-binding NtrC family response regulator
MMGQARPLRPVALVVEDNDDERALAATLLEETEMQVVECSSAEAALAAMDKTGDRLAMVFTDVRLSGNMDGVELAQVVDATRPSVTVLVTAGDPGIRLDDLPGRAGYIRKPWRARDVQIVTERARWSA